MLQRQITPTARGQLQEISATYGIGEKADAWCRDIVRTAEKKERPRTETSLQDALAELGQLARGTKSDWAHWARRFKDAGWGERLRSLIAFVKNRTAPYKLRVNSKVFMGLSDSSVPVEVKNVYEIDLTNGSVTFLAFAVYTPENEERGGTSDKPQNW